MTFGVFIFWNDKFGYFRQHCFVALGGFNSRFSIVCAPQRQNFHLGLFKKKRKKIPIEHTAQSHRRWHYYFSTLLASIQTWNLPICKWIMRDISSNGSNIQDRNKSTAHWSALLFIIKCNWRNNIVKALIWILKATI